jgi:hypothetical protein
MLKKLLGSVNFYAVASLNIMFAADHIKGRVRKLAKTETVHSAHEYVLVRLARGDYNNLSGLDTLKSDYKFYQIITNPKNGQPRN